MACSALAHSRRKACTCPRCAALRCNRHGRTPAAVFHRGQRRNRWHPRDDLPLWRGGRGWPVGGAAPPVEKRLERAVIFTTGATLGIVPDLLPPLSDAAPAEHDLTLESVERDHIVTVLQQTDWVVEGPRGAALILGLHPNTLRHRMKKTRHHARLPPNPVAPTTCGGTGSSRWAAARRARLNLKIVNRHRESG
jgi:hypothetical protein